MIRMTENWLDKKSTLFERDEEGKLLPQTLILETLSDKPQIKAIPIPRGVFQRIYREAKNGQTNDEQDSELIEKYLVLPKYTKEEIVALKPNIAGAIVTAIFSLSLGISQDKINDLTKKQVIEMNEEYLKKK